MDGPLTRDDLKQLTFPDLLTLADNLDVVDNGLEDRDDLIDRIILTQNKRQRNSHKPFLKFTEVREDTRTKCEFLKDFFQSLYSSFSNIPTAPLSEVLLKERLLKNPNLLLELQARKRAIDDGELLIIIAGETNGGKSSFLNVILGVKILPTDVLHCTIAICKIKYSIKYSIETLDNNDQKQFFTFEGWKDAHEKLKLLVAEEDMKTREKGSAYKEITLKMPSPILESGVTLVDTPGIGETAQMDDVTMNYIRSTRASAFIYVIKSDAAGGVQEDRLISFLRAIQEDYRNDSVEGAIDPRSALFICNRWDAISEEGVEKVKKNALTRLDIVWPGFQKEQMHFFSSKKTQLHLDADPDFVTDKLNDLVIGLKRLFVRAANNSIEHQYRWAKHFIQPASSHLSSMINHCISSNEELEDHFRTVASKQETLMKDSREDALQLQDTLAVYMEKLREEVCRILSDLRPCDMEDYQQLVTLSSGEKFLQDSKNRQTVDQWVVASIIHYCDKAIQETEILASMETDTKNKIKEHMGLFEEQIKEITDMVKGHKDGDIVKSDSSLSSSNRSVMSLSLSVSSFDVDRQTYIDFTNVDHAVKNLLGKKKKTGVLKSLPKVKSKIMKTVRSGGSGTSASKDYKNPSVYIEYCIKKNANLMKDSDEIIDGFVSDYLRIVNMYIKSAVERIPHFIEVNNELMDNIREHRKALEDEKCKMREVMEALEPCREQLQGYGLLYMEDLNADSVVFNSKRTSLVLSSLVMGESARPNDSGFLGSGSTRNRVRGFWVHLRNALIYIDEEPVDMTIKTYTCHMEKRKQLKEIASLRFLEHTNLAAFFGMTRIDINSANSVDEETDSCEKVSAFIFEGNLVSARVYKSNKLIVFRDFVKNFLHGLLCGLEFIHREKMVHLELNLDTVMVNSETGVVKLCQQCLPREVQLPEDLSIATDASICLSPAVLQGDEYGICDDIYAFGLLLWELVFPDNPPYLEQKIWPLERFIAEVFPSRMLGPQIELLPASDAVIKVLQGSLISGKGRICMAMTEIKSKLTSFMSDVQKDPIINQNKSRRPVVKPVRSGKSRSVESMPLRPPRPKHEANKGKPGSLSGTRSATLKGESRGSRSLDLPEPPKQESNVPIKTLSWFGSLKENRKPGNNEDRERKRSVPILPPGRGYQARKLSVPNIKVTAPFEGVKESDAELSDDSEMAYAGHENEDKKMERIWNKYYRSPLRKQGRVEEKAVKLKTHVDGMVRSSYSIPENLNKLSQRECKDRKGIFTQVRNKFSDSNSGNRCGSPARIVRRKKLTSDHSSTEDESIDNASTSSSLREGEGCNMEDRLQHLRSSFTGSGVYRRSWHNEPSRSSGRNSSTKTITDSQKSNSLTELNSLDTSDSLDTSQAFPSSSNKNFQIGAKYNHFKDTLNHSSSGDSGSSEHSCVNSSFFSECGQSSAYSSIRSCVSNVSDHDETGSFHRNKNRETLRGDKIVESPSIGLSTSSALPFVGHPDKLDTLKAIPSLNPDERSKKNSTLLSTENALPSFPRQSLTNLDTSFVSSAFPSQSQYEPNNNNQSLFSTENALPSFPHDRFKSSETFHSPSRYDVTNNNATTSFSIENALPSFQNKSLKTTEAFPAWNQHDISNNNETSLSTPTASLENLNFSVSSALPSLKKCETSKSNESFSTENALPSIQNKSLKNSDPFFSVSSALPSLNQYEISNNNKRLFSTENALPSIPKLSSTTSDEYFSVSSALPSVSDWNSFDSEEQKQFNDESHSNVFSDEMPAIDVSGLNFMNNASQSPLDQSSFESDNDVVYV